VTSRIHVVAGQVWTCEDISVADLLSNRITVDILSGNKQPVAAMIGRLREHFRQSMKEDFSPEKRKKVGGYVMGKAIGEGSFAKVHIGVHMLTKERVSWIKV